MTGEGIRRLREQQGWSQADLAAAINATIPGRNYSSGSISPWERGKRKVPDDVSAFLDELAIGLNLPPDDGEPSPSPLAGPASVGVEDDTAPGGDHPPTVTPQPPLGGGGELQRACTELWELVASGVGMLGAATGSRALMNDGAIIQADARALGEAWGRLAAQNATFRKMLLGMTEGGAWLQVALVTGTTVSKCYQGHAQLALETSRLAELDGHPAGDREREYA